MSSTVDYFNATADWRFVIADLRGADGSPYDLTGFTATVTFRPDGDRATDIQDCTNLNGGCVITPGTAANPNATPPVVATGSTITIVAAAANRTWTPTRPMLVVGDVMIAKTGVTPATKDEIKRLAFVALPGT